MDEIKHGDCFELLKELPDESIDLVLTDPPFDMTNNAWDVSINLEQLWKEYRRLIKPRGVIAICSLGKFSAKLISTAEDIYKYSWIWLKNKPRGFLNANRQPLRIHEEILIFYKAQPKYHPQKTTGHAPVHSYTKHTNDGSNYGKTQRGYAGGGSTERFPTTVLRIPVVNNDDPIKTHSTQKPVELGEYLIKTYTDPADVVLDNFCGSGAFLVAAKKLHRHYIGMENDYKFYRFATDRLLDDRLK